MSKISIFLQALAVIASLAGIILTFSAVSEYDRDLKSIALQKQKIKEAEKKLAELRDKHTSDQLRQKNRNLNLSEEIAEFKNSTDEIDVKLARTKEEIEDIENSLADITTDKDATKQRQSESATALRGVQSKIENLRGELPRIRQQVEAKRFEIGDFENRISELKQKLTVYAEITSVIRDHYLSTLSSLRTYERARSWLEPGEELSLKLKSVDLSSGFIALSEGGNAGLREDMIFSVKFENREISKIRVKKVFRNYSLAELIPLIGNPLELLTLEKVDLVVL
jgi:predicted  nucleic acid-binding Zn-ribbon protein